MDLSEVSTQELFDELRARGTAVVMAMKFTGDGGVKTPPAYWSWGDEDLCFAMANRLYNLTQQMQSESPIYSPADDDADAVNVDAEDDEEEDTHGTL